MVVRLERQGVDIIPPANWIVALMQRWLRSSAQRGGIALTTQMAPADNDAAHRDDRAEDRQQPHYNVPSRAVHQQQLKIETVQRVEQPAIGAPAAVHAADDIAGDRADVKPRLCVII